MDDDQETGVDREAVTLATWRIECLIRGGFDTYFAGRLAALEVDYRRAVALLERGCKQEQVEEILA